MNNNLKSEPAKNSQSIQLIIKTVKVLMGGVGVALCPVLLQGFIHSVDNHQLKQKSDQRDGLIAINSHLNWSSDFLKNSTQNAENSKSNPTQQLLEPMLKNTPIYSSCWLFPWLPGCQGDPGQF